MAAILCTDVLVLGDCQNQTSRVASGVTKGPAECRGVGDNLEKVNYGTSKTAQCYAIAWCRAVLWPRTLYPRRQVTRHVIDYKYTRCVTCRLARTNDRAAVCLLAPQTLTRGSLYKVGIVFSVTSSIRSIYYITAKHSLRWSLEARLDCANHANA